MKIRIARDNDKEYVMSWIKDIWSGHDYIPYTWDIWLKDSNGTLYVVDENEKAIALWHIIWLDDNVAWLEGMRVKPDHRNIGIATMTAKYSIDLARRKGFKHVMLITSSNNKPVIRVMEKIGFENVSRYIDFEVKEINVVDISSEIGCNIDWNYLVKRYYRLRENNFIIGYSMRPWIFTELNKNEFKILCRNKDVYVSSAGDALAIPGKLFKHEDIETFYIRYLDGYDETDIENTVKKILYKALEIGCKKIYGYIPSDDNLADALGKLGFEIKRDSENLVYRYDIRKNR